MRAFVYPSDDFTGRAISKKLTDEGFEVVGETPCTKENESKHCQSFDTKGLSEDQLDVVARSDVVIFSIYGNETASKEAVTHLANLDDGSKHVFIGISTPMTWARTVVPSVEPRSDELKEEDFNGIALTDKDAVRRTPAASARVTLEVENLILRSNKPNLRAHVVCPGILYGNGECDEGFHTLWKSGWEATQKLEVLGSGENIIPTIHVGDLVSYVDFLAKNDPEMGYLLAVDGGYAAQQAIVEGISNSLGAGEIGNIADKELFFRKGVQQLIIHLPMQPSIPEQIMFKSPGLIPSLQAVEKEYLESRNLTPLKILVMGPPMAGKSKLCCTLAARYELKHIDAREILQANAEDEDVQRELSGKGGRVSDQTMAKLCRLMLQGLPVRNRGYILDGWPKTMEQAQALFTTFRPMTPEEVSEKESKASDASDRPGSKGKPPKKGAKNTKQPPENDVPDGLKRVPDLDLFPNFLIRLDAAKEAMERRVQNVMSFEASEFAKLEAGGKPPPSHNNEKDFQRRSQAYLQERQRDDTDLEEKIEEIEAEYQRQTTVFSEAKAKEKELRERMPLRRRKMLEEAMKEKGSLDEELPMKPSFPKYGGFVGFFNGYSHVEEKDNTKDGAFDQLMESIETTLGPPHNYNGFVSSEGDCASRNVTPVDPETLAKLQGDREKELEAISKLLQEEEASIVEERSYNDKLTHQRSQPLKRYLLSEVMPLISMGLIEACTVRPDDPVDFLAQKLLDEANRRSDVYVDPYSSEVYTLQQEKIKAKEIREETRRRKAEEKIARDETARSLAEGRRRLEKEEAERRMTMRRASISTSPKALSPRNTTPIPV
ncbi:hypothetical protein BSKO_09691 [Bryopsis sp. KO-2023]|nr:hypothetical protein BSKO_09691 [Bryopsis sp. KO-2023]